MPNVTHIPGAKGGYDYLQVKDRIVWFRREHPDGLIGTEIVRADFEAGYAVARTTVTIPSTGGSAQATGSCSRAELAIRIAADKAKPDQAEAWMEFADTAATGRALARMGYGTEEALDADRPVDAPHQVQQNGQGEQPQATTRPTRKPAPTGPQVTEDQTKREIYRHIRAAGPLFADDAEVIGALTTMLKVSTGRPQATPSNTLPQEWRELAEAIRAGLIDVPGEAFR